MNSIGYPTNVGADPVRTGAGSDPDVNKTVAIFSHNIKNGNDAADEVLYRRKHGEYLLPEELKDVTKMSLEITSVPFIFYIEGGYVSVNDSENNNTEVHHIHLAAGSYTLKSFTTYCNERIRSFFITEYNRPTVEGKPTYDETTFDFKLAMYVQESNVDIMVETVGETVITVMFSENICKILGIPYEWFAFNLEGYICNREEKLIHLYCDLIDSSKNILDGKQNCLLHTFKFDHYLLHPLMDTKSKILPVSNHKFKSFRIWYSEDNFAFNLFDHLDKVTFTFTFYHGK